MQVQEQSSYSTRFTSVFDLVGRKFSNESLGWISEGSGRVHGFGTVYWWESTVPPTFFEKSTRVTTGVILVPRQFYSLFLPDL